MNLADPVNNIALADFHVGVLQQFRSLSPEGNIRAILEAQFGQVITALYYPGDAVSLRSFIGGSAQRKLIYIDGVRTPNNTKLLIDGYDNGSGPTATNGFNPWLQDGATRLVRQLTTTTLAQAEYVDVVGYSAGGAMAFHVVDQLKRRGFLYKTRVITFGSPRAGDTSFRQGISRIATARWMNVDDPIPLVPPRADDSPVLLLSIGVLTALRWASFVHSAGGIELLPDGSIEPGVLPTLASVNPVTSLLAWYNQIEDAPDNPHALATYRARMQFTLSRDLAPGRLNVPEGGAEVRVEGRRAKLNDAERQVGVRIQNVAREQNAVAPIVADAVLFKAVKIGRVWAVEFGGQIVLYAGLQKRARHIARAGNDFLRSMPKQALVDPQGILDQMKDFFNAAVLPGGPSNPPIRISL